MVLHCGYRGSSSPSSPDEYTDVTGFVSWLKAHIGKLRPVPACRHAAPSTFIFKDLATASHVFLRHGSLRSAIQAPYVGPYEVLHRSDKTYTMDIQGSAKTDYIERLKPAYVLDDDTEPASAPVLPASQRAPVSGYAFRISWGSSVLSGGVVADATG